MERGTPSRRSAGLFFWSPSNGFLFAPFPIIRQVWPSQELRPGLRRRGLQGSGQAAPGGRPVPKPPSLGSWVQGEQCRSQLSAAEHLLRWSTREANTGIQDVVHHTRELATLWLDAHARYAAQLSSALAQLDSIKVRPPCAPGDEEEEAVVGGG